MDSFRGACVDPEVGRGNGGQRHLNGYIIVERGVSIRGFKCCNLRIAIAAVRCDYDPRACVGNTVGQCLVAKAAEYRRVDYAKALCRFGPVNLSHNAWHVKSDAVTCLQPKGF